MAELVELKCPNCAGKVDWTGGAKAVCTHCRTEFLVPTEAAEHLACPICGKVDRVQKISAACRAPGADAGLNPPAEPLLGAKQGPIETLLAGCGFMMLSLFGPGFLLVGLLVRLSNPDDALSLLLSIVGLPMTVLLVVGILRDYTDWLGPSAMHQRSAKVKSWEKAMSCWEPLYYCARDDGVFIPGETTFIPIDKVQEFLYAD